MRVAEIKKPITNVIGVLAMRKARIYNYYNKRSHRNKISIGVK